MRGVFTRAAALFAALLLSAPAFSQTNPPAVLPATNSVMGKVRCDGTTTLCSNGVLSAIAGGSGINQLTGVISAGPGVGSQATTFTNGSTGSGWVVLSDGPTLSDLINLDYTVSTSTLSKASDTTLATIPGLSIAMTAGKTYSCRGHLNGTANASGGIRIAAVGTGGLTATSSSFTAWGLNGGTVIAASTTTTLGNNITAFTAAYTDLYVDGAIVVNAGGTLNLQAAQNVSFGTATTVAVNSTFACTRVN